MTNEERIDYHFDRLLASGETMIKYDFIITRADVIKTVFLGDSFKERALQLVTKAVNENYKDE